MISVYFERDGSKIKVDVEEGSTLMEAAKYNSHVDIPEIPADCGGACACATCHVYIDERWLAKIEKIDYNSPELDLLEYDKDFNAKTSRLSCQITLGTEHDGLIVKLRKHELL